MVALQDLVHLAGGPLLHGRGAASQPLGMSALVGQLGVKGLSEMAHGMLVGEIVARGPQFLVDVQGEGFLVDRHAPGGSTQPADGVVGDDLQLQRALQPGIHKADIVDDVGPMQQGRHQAHRDLHAALLVEHFGVGGAAQAKDGQVIVLAHLGGHALLVGQDIVADHSLQVVGATVPAGDGDRRSLADQLGQHDTKEGTGIHRGHAPGRGRRRVDAAGIEGNVQHGQALLRQVDALLQGLGVGHQAGGDVDVAGGKGTLLESLGAAGHDLAHLHGSHTALKVGRDKDDGLGGVIEHHLHLVAVVDALVHFGGQEHGHDKVELRQGILHDRGLPDVLKGTRSSLPGAVIEHVEAIGAAAIVGVIAPGPDGHAAVAVVEGQALGRRGQGPLDHDFRDAQPDAVGPGPSLDQELARLLVVDVDAHPLQDLQAGEVDLFSLLLSHAGIVGTGCAQPVCFDHLPARSLCCVIRY